MVLRTKKSIGKTKQNDVDGANGASNADFREELTDSSKDLKTKSQLAGFWIHQRGDPTIKAPVARLTMRLRSFVSYQVDGIRSASTHKISEKSMATVLQDPMFAIERYWGSRVKGTKKLATWKLSIESSRLRPGLLPSYRRHCPIRNHVLSRSVPAALSFSLPLSFVKLLHF